MHHVHRSKINKKHGISIDSFRFHLSSVQLDDWVLCRIYKKNSNNNNARLVDRDREDPMDDRMAPPALAQQPSISTQSNPRPQHQRAPNSYTALLDSDETFFEGLLTTEDGLPTNPITQLAVAPRPKLDLSTIPTNNSTRPPKRALTCPYWSDAGMVTPPPPKRFQVCNNGSSSNCTTTNNNNNSSGSSSGAANNSSSNNSNSNHGGHTIAALLNQFPQVAAYQHQTILGSLGDGSSIFQPPYQLSGANWSSL